MKKTITAAAAAILSLLLVGCSGDKDSGRTSEETVSASAEPTAPSVSESEPESVVSAESSEEPSVTEESAETAQSAPTEEPETEDTADYVALIQQYDNIWLGLPSASKVYVFSDKQISAEINGVTCHAVSCFDEHEDTLYYMCDFYISEDGQTVYRDETSKNAAEGEPPEFILLPEETGLALLDPSTQSAEDIFAAAKELSALFTPFGSHVIECDSADTLDVDGNPYDRVTDERFSTKEKMLSTLERYFSMELIGSWMELGYVAEQDGNIYVRHNDGVGGNPYFDRSEYELTFLSDESAMFTEYRYYIYEGNEEECVERTHTAQFANGVWRFTDFTLEQID